MVLAIRTYLAVALAATLASLGRRYWLSPRKAAPSTSRLPSERSTAASSVATPPPPRNGRATAWTMRRRDFPA